MLPLPDAQVHIFPAAGHKRSIINQVFLTIISTKTTSLIQPAWSYAFKYLNRIREINTFLFCINTWALMSNSMLALFGNKMT